MDISGGPYSAHQNPPHWFFHVSPWRHCSGVVSFSSNERGFPEVCWQGGSWTPALPAWCQHEKHCWSQWKLEQAGWLQDCQWIHNSVTEREFPFQQLWPYKQQDIPSMVCVPNLDLCSEPANSIINLSLLFCSTAFSGLLTGQAQFYWGAQELLRHLFPQWALMSWALGLIPVEASLDTALKRPLWVQDPPEEWDFHDSQRSLWQRAGD